MPGIEISVNRPTESNPVAQTEQIVGDAIKPAAEAVASVEVNQAKKANNIPNSFGDFLATPSQIVKPVESPPTTNFQPEPTGTEVPDQPHLDNEEKLKLDSEQVANGQHIVASQEQSMPQSLNPPSSPLDIEARRRINKSSELGKIAQELGNFKEQVEHQKLRDERRIGDLERAKTAQEQIAPHEGNQEVLVESLPKHRAIVEFINSIGGENKRYNAKIRLSEGQYVVDVFRANSDYKQPLNGEEFLAELTKEQQEVITAIQKDRITADMIIEAKKQSEQSPELPKVEIQPKTWREKATRLFSGLKEKFSDQIKSSREKAKSLIVKALSAGKQSGQETFLAVRQTANSHEARAGEAIAETGRKLAINEANRNSELTKIKVEEGDEAPVRERLVLVTERNNRTFQLLGQLPSKLDKERAA